MNFVSVAIDGPSGAGKSTLAKMVGERLGFLYVDTGAMYRTVAVAAYKRGINPEHHQDMIAMLPELSMSLSHGADGLQHMILDGEDVTQEIRRHEISALTALVSAIPEVRTFLLEQQRTFSKTQNIIMDGRDIGTVVLPDADVKIFLTASLESRAKRRYDELLSRGQEASYEQILEDVAQRDYADYNRPTAPLKQAEDAILVDTTGINLAQSLELLLKTIKESLDR